MKRFLLLLVAGLGLQFNCDIYGGKKKRKKKKVRTQLVGSRNNPAHMFLGPVNNSSSQGGNSSSVLPPPINQYVREASGDRGRDPRRNVNLDNSEAEWNRYYNSLSREQQEETDQLIQNANNNNADGERGITRQLVVEGTESKKRKRDHAKEERDYSREVRNFTQWGDEDYQPRRKKRKTNWAFNPPNRDENDLPPVDSREVALREQSENEEFQEPSVGDNVDVDEIEEESEIQEERRRDSDPEDNHIVPPPPGTGSSTAELQRYSEDGLMTRHLRSQSKFQKWISGINDDIDSARSAAGNYGIGIDIVNKVNPFDPPKTEIGVIVETTGDALMLGSALSARYITTPIAAVSPRSGTKLAKLNFKMFALGVGLKLGRGISEPLLIKIGEELQRRRATNKEEGSNEAGNNDSDENEDDEDSGQSSSDLESSESDEDEEEEDIILPPPPTNFQNRTFIDLTQEEDIEEIEEEIEEDVIIPDQSIVPPPGVSNQRITSRQNAQPRQRQRNSRPRRKRKKAPSRASIIEEDEDEDDDESLPTVNNSSNFVMDRTPSIRPARSWGNLRREFEQKAGEARANNDQELAERYNKRVDAIRRTTDRTWDYSHEVDTDEFENSYAEYFRNRNGNAFDKYLHEELCDTRETARAIQVSDPNNKYIQILCPSIYYHTALAKTQRNPEAACKLSDFSFKLCRVLEKGLEIASDCVVNVGMGLLDTLNPMQYVHMAKGVCNLGELLVKEVLRHEQLDQAFFTFNPDVFYEDTVQYHDYSMRQKRVFKRQAKKTLYDLKNMTWQEWVRVISRISFSTVIDRILFHALGRFVEKSGREMVKHLDRLFQKGNPFAKRQMAEAVGGVKIAFEEGAQSANGAFRAIKNNPRLLGQRGKTAVQAVKESPSLANVEKILEKVRSYEQARNKALEIVGDLGPNARSYIGRLGKGNGKIVGRQSLNGKVRWRLDYDPSKGTHINVEDFRIGKGLKAIKVAIPFEGNERTFESLLRHLNR